MCVFLRHPLHKVLNGVVVEVRTALLWTEDDVVNRLVRVAAEGTGWGGVCSGDISVVPMQVVHCSVTLEDVLRVPSAKCWRIYLGEKMIDRFPVDLAELIGRKKSLVTKYFSCSLSSELKVYRVCKVLYDSLP